MFNVYPFLHTVRWTESPYVVITRTRIFECSPIEWHSASSAFRIYPCVSFTEIVRTCQAYQTYSTARSTREHVRNRVFFIFSIREDDLAYLEDAINAFRVWLLPDSTVFSILDNSRKKIDKVYPNVHIRTRVTRVYPSSIYNDLYYYAYLCICTVTLTHNYTKRLIVS